MRADAIGYALHCCDGKPARSIRYYPEDVLSTCRHLHMADMIIGG